MRINKFITIGISKDFFYQLLFLMYSLFLAGFFFYPSAPGHYRFYYIAILPLGIFAVPASFRLLKTNRLFWLVVLYIAYMALSSFWSELFSLSGLRLAIMEGLYVFIFCIVTVVLYNEYPEKFERLLQIVCVIAGVVAIIAMGIWYRDNPFPQTRIPGIWRIPHEVRSACAYGFVIVLTTYYALYAKELRIQQGYTLLVFILLLFVILTQSRTGLVAIGLGLLILFLAEDWRKAGLSLLLLAGVCSVLLILYPQLGESLVRKDLYRLNIWSSVMDRSLHDPFFGHGYLSDRSVSVASIQFMVAHSSYLATLRDGGFVGLAILLSLLGYACWSALCIGRESGNYRLLALLIYGMACMLPDGDRLLNRPREEWLFLWLPLALVLAEQCARQRLARTADGGADGARA